ncbi:MAG TPA: OmpA family protein [Reyranella sp.]|nr:OmpA family protein [Reyranella sp.]
MRRAGRFVALVVAGVAIGSSCFAQVPHNNGFFAHIDGRWMWLGGDRPENALVTDQRMTSGPGGQLMIGYKIADTWDVSLAGDVQTMITSVTQLLGGMLKTDTNHQHVDLEIGYSQGWWRVNGGVRAVHYLMSAGYNTPFFAGYDQREMYGLGPKIGGGALLPLSEPWSLIGGVNAALVYTSFVDTGTGALAGRGSYWQFVPQLGAELGVNWRSPQRPSFSITVGGAINASFNTTIAADGSRRGTLLEFGPFVRMAYNFAGPTRVRHPTVTASDGDAPAKFTANYTLFFDFDRASLSPLAANTLRSIADDARHGRETTVQVTSHGAGMGDETYNKMLATRRAAALQDELRRQGLDSRQIDSINIIF